MSESMDLSGRSVLVTGGTGSFGRRCVETILSKFKPDKLIVFSRDENKQHEMSQALNSKVYPCVRYFIGDVRDLRRLQRAFKGVDFVIHAAALKQVPAAEYNPIEFVKTNIIGAQNVLDAAIDSGVKRVIALSTDKAACPANLYGATKLCADKLFISGNVYAGENGTRLSVVRYGNVLGSRGSVLPFFAGLRHRGVLPITDPRMTRFWITLEQGVEFVLQSLAKMEGGETFVPKLPSMKIVDLARAVAPECRHEVVGIRPGEKIHETLITEDEGRHTLELEHHFVIEPEFEVFWDGDRHRRDGGKPLSEGYSYSSDSNPLWLTIEDLHLMIESEHNRLRNVSSGSTAD
jgi:UDP-N-acetylglucosamine 4,6-dehydratase